MAYAHRLFNPGWLALALALLPAAIVLADDGDTIFREPPAPAQLAAILFGPKYRSAVTDPGAPGRFGMMINFEYDSTKIVPKSLPLLDSVGEMLKSENLNNETLIVEGHADASGPAAYNQALSERRADAVKRYLVGTFNIDEDKVIAVGSGETDLHNVRDPYHEDNRRVIFGTARSIVID